MQMFRNPSDQTQNLGRRLCRSGHLKAGLAGEEAPSVVLPAVVGRPKHDSAFLSDKKDMSAKWTYSAEDRSMYVLQFQPCTFRCLM